MSLEILHRLEEHAVKRASCVAIREVNAKTGSQRTITFAQLATRVRSFATTLQQTLMPGDVVIICLPNQIECTVAFLASLRAQTVGFLINPAVTRRELRQAAKSASAKAMVGSLESCAAVADLGVTAIDISIEIEASQAIGRQNNHGHDHLNHNHCAGGLMLLSSGTTGDPKIVLRDGPSLDAVARNISNATKLSFDDCVLGLIPLCHSYGVEHGILAPTYAGCCVHLCRGFDASVVPDQLRNGCVTVLPGVPSVFEMLAILGDGSHAFPSLRCAYSAGSQLPQSVYDACLDQLGLRVGQLYGSSEVGSVMFNDPSTSGHDPMSSGYPMSGVIVKIVDPQTQQLDEPLPPGVEGELAIHAPSMLSGYVDQPTATRDGFFFTGDLARQDTDGAVTITGRIKLQIDVGALKVNPLEVESVLLEHNDVKDCVVLAAKVSDTVSRVRALVVPRDETAPPSCESLRAFARARLSTHKTPRVIEIVKSLPKSPSGKILRRQIAS